MLVLMRFVTCSFPAPFFFSFLAMKNVVFYVLSLKNTLATMFAFLLLGEYEIAPLLKHSKKIVFIAVLQLIEEFCLLCALSLEYYSCSISLLFFFSGIFLKYGLELARVSSWVRAVAISVLFLIPITVLLALESSSTHVSALVYTAGAVIALAARNAV